MERHTRIAAQRRFKKKNDQKLPSESVYKWQLPTQTRRFQTQRWASRPKWEGLNPGVKLLLAQNVEFHVYLCFGGGRCQVHSKAFESVSKSLLRRSQIVGGRFREQRSVPAAADEVARRLTSRSHPHMRGLRR